MADEFIKGLGIFTGGGLAWLVLASWYRTTSFESTQQLVAPVSDGGMDLYNSLGVALMDVFFWFTLIGALTFWVLIPAGRQARKAIENRRAQ
ncbi:DUF7314 family protein [Salinigranum marinum]|jgi:hypothetical protein|uniref:DUF7314 family protein n=1 Tax=Salinigranum marinum TaxID=1515595 RepID=UPI002989E99E|nr:hypothetical protein [Salinigranum marinum]